MLPSTNDATAVFNGKVVDNSGDFTTPVVTLEETVTATVGATATTAATAVTLTAANADILPGQLVTGAGIDGPVTVESIDGTALTLSSAQTIAASAVLTFSTIVTDTTEFYYYNQNTLVYTATDMAGAGTPQHGLSSKKMAQITSGGGKMRFPSIKWL